MDEGIDLQPGHRHIIRRPRLTRLLDESRARIVLLIAPAGYGKTTLAREWLSSPDRIGAWYRATPASADVAALALGLAEAATSVVPGAGARMRERLKASSSPEQDIQPLAELLAEDLSEWPENAWLVIDDYHLLVESDHSEALVELVIGLAPLRLLVTSRSRPRWLTARRVLYGEIRELDRSVLAMTEDEAREVLALPPTVSVPPLVARADGWPVVIAMAALTDAADAPDAIPSKLYQFLAEEILSAIRPAVREDFARLAIAPILREDVIELLSGSSRPDDLLEEGLRLGLLGRGDPGSFTFHPLFRAFLEAKIQSVHAPIKELGALLLRQQRWDETFDLVLHHRAGSLLVDLIRTSLSSILAVGRILTLKRWLDFAQQLRLSSPILDLAAAECALRQGQCPRAEALALNAARELPEDDPLAPRALILAGEAAHFSDRSELSIQRYRLASERAKTDRDRLDALWGEFLGASSLEQSNAADLLKKLAEAPYVSAEDVVRIANGRYILGQRTGDLAGAYDAMATAFHLLEKVDNPMIKTSFLNGYSNILVVRGEYATASKLANREIDEAALYKLDFVLPHAFVSKAGGELGLRNFKSAELLLERASNHVATVGDVHLTYNIAATRIRLYLAQGATDLAIRISDRQDSEMPSRAMYGEFIACRSLALATGGLCARAIENCDLAEELTLAVETVTLVPLVRAIVSIDAGEPHLEATVRSAFDNALDRGVVDSFVAAYRAYPELLRVTANVTDRAETLRRILARARDYDLAVAAGVGMLDREPGDAEDAERSLSRREQEVFRLLGKGLTNREIAAALVISEATAKVHVRRIFEKLGLRSRTEAAVIAAAASRSHATSADPASPESAAGPT